jgi:hypothetical protein
VNYLIIESLQRFHYYYGDDFKIECPTGSGKLVTINDAANEVTRRLARVFLKDERGVRPVSNYHSKLATDPHFRDYVFFHEYFHGDTGRGVGASHQTGWTGLIAKLLQPRGSSEAVEERRAHADGFSRAELDGHPPAPSFEKKITRGKTSAKKTSAT